MTTLIMGAILLFITVAIAWSLAPIALWLWMARENGRGRNWARIVSTVLFGLATLDLTGAFRWPPGIQLSLVPEGFGWFGPTVPVLYWLVGAAVVWLLWRPASSAFFKSARAARSRPSSQISGP